MKKNIMINEKYIQRVSIDEAVIANLKDLIKSKKMNMKLISEMDESISYGYLRQVLQGNHPTVSYDFVKRLCKCLNADIASVFNGLITYS
jgi:hypothetical protein